MDKRHSKVLVTGASGFVGGHIALGLAKAGSEVVAVEHTRACADEVVAQLSRLERLDLSDSGSVATMLKRCSPEIVVHAAALANSSQCEDFPELAVQQNVEATKVLLKEFEHRNEGSRFIYISTDLVFDGGNAPAGGFVEASEPCPLSQYGKTKREAERLVLGSSLDSYVVRSCLVYGRRLGDNEGFLAWLRKGLQNNEPVKLFTDEWRTPVFVEDIVRGLIAVIEKSPEQRVFHFGGSERLSRYEFGQKYCETLGFDSSHLVASSRLTGATKAPRPADVSLNSALTSAVLGVEFVSPENGLRSMR